MPSPQPAAPVLVPVDIDDPELSRRLQAYWRDLGVVPAPAWHAHYLLRLREEEGRTRHTFWGQVDGQRIGLVMVRFDADWLEPKRRAGYVVEFTVFDSWRRRGYGRALFAATRRYLMASGCSHVELDVLPHNHVGRAFWQSLGFQVIYHHMRERA